MKKANLFRGVIATLAAAILLTALAGGGRLIGQEKDGDKPAAEKKEKAKPRGRLPAYFSSVVSKKQREDIYKIQGKYRTQLEELQKQIAALEEQRNKEVDAVLSPEQLAEVNKKREEADKKRKERQKKPAPKPEK